MNNISWTDDQLIKDWVRRYSSQREDSLSTSNLDEEKSKRIDAETFWVVKAMYELEMKNPAHAWQLMLKILELAPDDDNVLDSLAAGPVEDILNYHTNLAIKWIESEVKKNSRFKDLLLSVWRSHSTSDDIWQRVENATK